MKNLFFQPSFSTFNHVETIFFHSIFIEISLFEFEDCVMFKHCVVQCFRYPYLTSYLLIYILVILYKEYISV